MSKETRYPGQPEFHYNREDRVEGLSDYASRHSGGGGIFKRNRSLAITLLDVIVLLLLFVIVNVYIRTRSVPELFEDIAVEAEATRSDDRAFVTIMFERTGPGGPVGEVRVLLRALPDDTRLDSTAFLPEEEGEVRVVRLGLEVRAAKPRIFATISAGDRDEVIEIDIVD